MAPNAYQIIIDKYDKFPRQQKKIADYILTYISEVIYYPVARMANDIGVSNASIVRFAKNLGYEGFPEFREDLFSYYREMFSPSERVKALMDDFSNEQINYRNITEKEIYYLQKSINLIDEGRFAGAVNLICSSSTVQILGVGPNEMLGRHLAFRLRRYRLKTIHHNAGGIHLIEGLIDLDKKDVAVAYNFYKTSEELKMFIDIMKKNSIPVILITDIMTPAVIKDCSIVLCAERGPHGAFHSPVVPMAVTNALLVGAAHLMGQSALNALEKLGNYRQEFFYNIKGDNSSES